jgi:integrase
VKRELTDRYLRTLSAPDAGRLEVSDTKRTGLRFRLSATGRATWVFEKRVKGGTKRKHTLGTWPAVTLSEARKVALEIEAESSQGVDRVAIAEQRHLEEEAAKVARLTVREVLRNYNELHLSQLRGGAERLRQIEQSFESRMDLPISNLETKHLQVAIDAKLTAGRAVFANRIRSALRAFTAWAWQRGYLEEDIGLRVGKAAKEQARERVPSLTEVRAIYNACDNMGALWGPLFKLLLLTGQRRGEIVKLRWEEVDLPNRRIVKPGSETKNGKPHITHLSKTVLNLLERLEGERSGWVFTTTGDTPVSGVSKAKARLDKLLGTDVAPWRLHDLRTAFATALAEAGEPENVVDRILNHSAVGSAPSAVARVYNRGELLVQRARALDTWAGMVTCTEAQVVQLHGTGG